MADRTLGVRASGVIHERLDDEVIAIDLDRGIYFAMAGPAADVWTAFQGSAALPAVIDALAKRYHAPSDALRPDVEAFVEHLAQVGLLVPAPPEDAMQPAVVDEPPTGPWATPEIEAYNDMADLVLLDPIHQVDEAGWPHLPTQEPIADESHPPQGT